MAVRDGTKMRREIRWLDSMRRMDGWMGAHEAHEVETSEASTTSLRQTRQAQGNQASKLDPELIRLEFAAPASRPSQKSRVFVSVSQKLSQDRTV